MLLNNFLLVVLFSCFLVFCSALNIHNLALEIQTDLESLNATCENHFCESYTSLELSTFRSCSCESDCAVFDNCCLDARGFSEGRWLKDNSPECLSFRGDTFFTKSKCPSDTSMHYTKHMCERSTLKKFLDLPPGYGTSFSSNSSGYILEDPLLFFPVFSLASKMNYINIFCAICNGESFENSSFWNITFDCKNDGYIGEFSDHNMITNRTITRSRRPKRLPRNENETSLELCSLYFEPEDEMLHLRSDCVVSISDCPADYFGDQKVVRFCKSYTAYVFDDRENIYRNPHCALCNGVQPLCERTARNLHAPVFSRLSFSVLLDYLGGGQVGFEQSSGNCSADQVWDPFREICRSLFCSSNFVLHDGSCRQNSVLNSSELLSVNDSAKESNFLSCPKIHLGSESFEMMDNGTVIVALFNGLVLQPGEYQVVIRSGNSRDKREIGQTIEICSPAFEKQSKFDTTLGYLTMICLLISIVSLGIHIFASLVLSEQRSIPVVNLASLSICLLAFYVGFLASLAVGDRPSTCRILAVLNFSLYMAAFCWMNVMAFDVFFSLRMASRQLRVMSEDGFGRYLLYLSYVLLVVLLLTSLALLADLGQLPGLPEQLVPRFGQQLSVCWFGNRPALLAFVAVPLMLILLVNVGLFIATVSIIHETRASTVSHTCSASVMNFRLYWRLSLMMGLSWLVSLLNGWLDIDYLHYIATIVNTLQGFFIFVSFTLNDKVRAKLMARLRRYNAVVSWSRDTTTKSRGTNSTLASVTSTPGGKSSARGGGKHSADCGRSLQTGASHSDGVSGTTRL